MRTGGSSAFSSVCFSFFFCIEENGGHFARFHSTQLESLASVVLIVAANRSPPEGGVDSKIVLIRFLKSTRRCP